MTNYFQFFIFLRNNNKKKTHSFERFSLFIFLCAAMLEREIPNKHQIEFLFSKMSSFKTERYTDFDWTYCTHMTLITKDFFAAFLVYIAVSFVTDYIDVVGWKKASHNTKKRL